MINVAANTTVDQAKPEKPQATAGNALAPSWRSRAPALGRVPVIHILTGYVHDGAKPMPMLKAIQRRRWASAT